jgi:hypothetical protein
MDAQTDYKQFHVMNDQDIGKAVGDWTTDYNKRHGKAVSNSLHNELPIHIQSS